MVSAVAYLEALDRRRVNPVTDPDLDGLRLQLAELLDSGLQTDWQERAYTSASVNRIVAQLQQVEREDYAAKLKIAGLTVHSYRPPEEPEIEQACSTCMYYERNRRYCNLPELALPVKPEWSCVLWRI